MRRAPLIAALLITGCAQLPWQPPPDEASVDALAAQHQYVTALARLDRSREEPDYEARRDALLAAADRYREELFTEIAELVDRGLVAAAQLQLEQALPQLPASPALARQTRRFEAARERFVQDQLAELRELRGQHLLREQPYFEKLMGVDGGAELQAAVERHRRDSIYFADLLREAGSRAIDAREYERAVRLLTTANRLHPEKRTADLLQTAASQRLAAQDRAQSLRQQQRSQRYLDLKSDFADAMSRGDYHAARRHLEAAETLGGDHADEVAAWRQTLAGAIDAAVERHTARGDSHYAEGRVEQALRSWQRAHELHPSAELQNRIERAQRLMARYRELQEIPPADTPRGQEEIWEATPSP